MPTDATPRFNLPFLHTGQAQKEIFHNEALTRADILVHAHALSAALGEPPAAPSEGQCWIVNGSPSGAWLGHAGAFACWTSGGWRFVLPRAGMKVRVADEELDYVHDGNAWQRSEIRPAGLFLSNVQVVGEREPAIAPPSGGPVVDGQAREAILAILNALQNHGLIEETE